MKVRERKRKEIETSTRALLTILVPGELIPRNGLEAAKNAVAE
jgi:hypothetical protein